MTKNGEVFDFEYRMKHKEGDWHWFWSRESIFKRSSNGRLQQILGTAQDITKRKKAEAERERPELILLDLALPECDGLAVFKYAARWQRIYLHAKPIGQ